MLSRDLRLGKSDLIIIIVKFQAQVNLPDILMETHLLWILAAAGYSSISTMFLLRFSMKSFSPSGGIQVCTNLDVCSQVRDRGVEANLRSEVQGGVSIEMRLIMEELVRRPR